MQVPSVMNVRPSYQVQRLAGTVERPIRKVVDGKIVTMMQEQPAGFMVYFPQGTSLRVETVEQLAALGLDGEPQLIDMESGEPFMIPRVDLKHEVERTTKRRGRIGTSDVVADAEEA